MVDILPPEKTNPHVSPVKKTGKRVLKSMFRRKSSGSPPQVDGGYLEQDVVEELIEEGSALLSERFVLLLNHFRYWVSESVHTTAKSAL